MISRRRVLLLVVAGGLGLVWLVSHRESREQLLADGRRALLKQQPELASEIADRLLSRDVQDAEGLMLAAAAARQTNAFEEAIAYCQRVPPQAADTYADAQCLSGQLALQHLGRVSDAEAYLRKALSIVPDHSAALEEFSYVLSLQTRTRDLIPVQLALIRLGKISPEVVLPLMQADLLFPDAEYVEQLRMTDPDCAGLLLAQARIARLRDDIPRARALLEQAAKLNPLQIESHVRLGRLLMEHGTEPELQRWTTQLSEAAFDHPDTWNTLGQIALASDNTKSAARCFWEAGKRAPESRIANYQLGRLLSQLQREAEAKTFLRRGDLLERYEKMFDRGAMEHMTQANLSSRLEESAELTASLGLRWEAYAFANLARNSRPPTEGTREASDLPSPMMPDLPLQRTAPADNPFTRLDLSDWPIPEISGSSSAEPEEPRSSRQVVHFDEIAEQVGIRFQYNNGQDTAISGAQRVYDFTGGGIAVLDADRDSWPDLYFSQGARLDDVSGQTLSGDSDQLFRNLRGHHFDNVSRISLATDSDYSQGVSSGDLNNDGFTDLFVGNLGANRLLRNNGDGTFTDISASMKDDAARWTTSTLICDLDGDQCPDLYSVNYLSGEILSTVCRDSTGRKNSCAPQSFPAARDQLHRNDGGGGFTDATSGSRHSLPDGKGLGIVAADLNGDHALDVFIANDGMPNFLFLGAHQSDQSMFQDVAMARGVAVNSNGQSEACMGVVVEDLNLDSRPDLFVTNFMDETNTLYSDPQLTGFFRDTTRTSGLGPASLKTLGFGTQAVDAELDGLPDLLVANGHVDDFSDRDVPYQMRPQYFQNLGHMKFAEAVPASMGTYFTQVSLGRTMARVDWDRDGAEDAVIGHLDRPAGLLHNTTQPRGSSVTVSLIGTSGQRDAFGTVVQVRTGNKSVTRQLVAGDGYQASNQRILVFGLGDSHSPISLHIAWPGEQMADYSDVAVNQHWIAVEGRDVLYSLPQ